MLFNPRHGLPRAGIEAAPDARSIIATFAQARRSRPCVDDDRIDRLLAAGAFTDAALALVAATLPGWHLRHLACDDGAWHCALSREPSLPAELDATADAWHELLPVAILDALAEARMMEQRSPTHPLNAVRVRDVGGYIHCCDNFA